MYSGVRVNAIDIIASAFDILWALQFSVIVILMPFLMRQYSLTECCYSILPFILIPLPFFILAWLAAALEGFVIMKSVLFLTAISFLTIVIVCPINRFGASYNVPVKLDTALCLMISSVIWLYREQWLSWIH